MHSWHTTKSVAAQWMSWCEGLLRWQMVQREWVRRVIVGRTGRAWM